MKILLINSPIRLDAKPSCIPTGLAIIAAVLRQHGYEVEIYDCNALRPSNTDIIRKIESGTWDIVGVSGLITTYRWQKWILRKLKAVLPKALLISGGGLSTTNNELMFATTPVDICVIGEGETAMLNICRGKVLPNGRVTVQEPNIKDLDALPFPAWDLLPMEIYLNNPIWGDDSGNSSQLPGVKVKRSMNVITSRGCPYSCNYCYHLFGRGQYRQRSVDSVIAEVDSLIYRYNVDFIGFVDDNMMTSKGWMKHFCRKIAHKGIAWGCHGRTNNADPEILGEMYQAGCRWVGYGIESGSPKILKAMNKKATVEQARQAILNTRAVGIFPNTTFIFGYPGEDGETVQETLDFKRELGIKCPSFYATPYPGTPLFEQIRHLIPDDFVTRLGNATEYTINLTDWSDAELFRQKAKYDFQEDLTQGKVPRPGERG
jgi:anaerobic magnesium-protoporphyrin IX monomethyl ester cyclase